MWVYFDMTWLCNFIVEKLWNCILSYLSQIYLLVYCSLTREVLRF